MQTIEVGDGAQITPYEVKSRGLAGWVALVSGTHPKYELKREFLENKRKKAWVTYRLTERGLYEFRGLGPDESAGFFLLGGSFRRKVRLLERDMAFALAQSLQRK